MKKCGKPPQKKRNAKFVPPQQAAQDIEWRAAREIEKKVRVFRIVVARKNIPKK